MSTTTTTNEPAVSEGATFTIAVGDRRVRPKQTAKAKVTAVTTVGRGQQVTYTIGSTKHTAPLTRFQASIVP